jgi:beta-aspartyl-peptidase (threonine type)
VLGEVESLGGSGGIILVTPDGQAVQAFTTPGMYRAEASPAGRSIAIYADEG